MPSLLLLEKIRVEPASGCWLWLGSKDADGYGRIGNNMAHRVFYEWFIGPIPEHLTIDHGCRTRACVNPAHMEPVTLVVNILRGKAFKHFNEPLCKRGHERTPENTQIQIRNGRALRSCIKCRYEQKKRHHHYHDR